MQRVGSKSTTGNVEEEQKAQCDWNKVSMEVSGWGCRSCKGLWVLSNTLAFIFPQAMKMFSA